MNRLIIVGNGFDLAHKLKTGYCDFITDYISRSINCFYDEGISIDPMMEIKNKYRGNYFEKTTRSTPGTALRDLQYLKEHDLASVSINSKFLTAIIERLSEINWVDLENDYFDQLISLKDHSGFILKQVEELNIEFYFLKNELEKYLIKQQKESQQVYDYRFTNIFCEPINGKEIVTRNIFTERPKENLILNFNYTSTLEKYKEKCCEVVHTEINYIHGKLDTKTNPIIFGFGDEFNKHYLGFEELRNKEILKHIKSFGYFKASNYHNLIRFIRADDFQVYIFGHSLGLSDRTMLKEIFENDKCVSIKIFYHQPDDDYNDYTDKTFDISSHFSDKGMMRKKIVPFNQSSAMPQVK